jgi:carbon storage regulator CsrA
MLALTRKAGEKVILEGIGEIQVVEVRGDKVKLGFNMPASVRIVRDDAKVTQPPSTRRYSREHAFSGRQR